MARTRDCLDFIARAAPRRKNTGDSNGARKPPLIVGSHGSTRGEEAQPEMPTPGQANDHSSTGRETVRPGRDVHAQWSVGDALGFALIASAFRKRAAGLQVIRAVAPGEHPLRFLTAGGNPSERQRSRVEEILYQPEQWMRMHLVVRE